MHQLDLHQKQLIHDDALHQGTVATAKADVEGAATMLKATEAGLAKKKTEAARSKARALEISARLKQLTKQLQDLAAAAAAVIVQHNPPTTLLLHPTTTTVPMVVLLYPRVTKENVSKMVLLLHPVRLAAAAPSTGFSGGFVYRFINEYAVDVVPTMQGDCVFHAGQVRHGALPTEVGTRFTLITFWKVK